MLLWLLTIAAITSLQQRSAAGRDAQITLRQVDRALVQVQVDPFISMDAFGGDPARARAATKADLRQIEALLNSLRREDEPAQVERLETPLPGYSEALDGLLPVVATPDFLTNVDPRLYPLLTSAAENRIATTKVVAEAENEYRSRAERAQWQATVGSAGAIVLLFAAFAFVFRGSARARRVAESLGRDNARLVAANREETRTDALTGLAQPPRVD